MISPHRRHGRAIRARNSSRKPESLENLESRLLFSAGLSLKPVVPLDVALRNPSMMYGRSGASQNVFDDVDGLSVSYTPATQTLENLDGYLSGADKSHDALTVAKSFLASHAGQLGLSKQDIASAVVSDQYTDSDTGITHIYLRQTLNGLAVVNADMGIHLTRDNRVINVTSSFLPNLGQAEGVSAPAVAQMAVDKAARYAAKALKLTLMHSPVIEHQSSDGKSATLTSAEASLDPIPATLEYVATASGVELSWNLVMRLPHHNNDWYQIAVNDGTGRVTFANNWTDHLAQYDVFPIPTRAPNDGSRQLLSDPSDPLASPFRWQDTNGAAGAEFTDTRGNNVSAQEDTDANNTGGFRPSGGTALNFDFPLDLTQAPSVYQSAAITNLFYWNNLLHDIHYHYGFTEAAGNFQVNNYGRGGVGNDPVQADAQDGSGTNNANFSTPPDGSSGRMQMYLWTSTSPQRDGDLDATIMVHEYGHGVSNRLTGGPANASALDALQSGGMGEGWSDWWALMFTQQSNNALTGSFPVATYVVGQSNTGAGIRRYPYSYNMTVDPLTIDRYGSGTTSTGQTRSTEVHNTGEIWCTTLWDMSALLEQRYGYDSNLYTGYTGSGAGGAGNKLALQLVMDALKLQPANPSFSQARDAILLADQNLTGGANQDLIWQAFARRGMGFSFSDGGSSGATSVTPAFNLPPVDPVITAQTPSAALTQVTPVSSMTFTFDEPIDPTSFSLSDDVTFTGPGNTNLAAQLTGFSFAPGNRVLTVNFAPTSAAGTYTMTLGPNILSADNGHAMDQNQNGTPGEAADTYTGTFKFASRIADASGFGYQAGQWAYEDLHLTPGGPGVTSVLTSSDDATVVIPMGTNTFNLFGVTYSATSSAGSVNVCDNGFLSFATAGSASTAFSNTDFTSPVAARFAPLWDDWYTQVDANDQVLYRFDDLNGDGVSDRLVVEWHDVHSTGGGSGVTFQGILQLNTGSTPGVMIANYPDIQSDNTGASNGGSASVGIKDTGTPPTNGNRLLVSQDNGSFPWLGDGKAIRIATDWTAPTITNSAFNYLTGPQTATVTFSEDVGASLAKGDFTLTNTTTAQVVPAANYTLVYSAATKTATITFPGFTGGILPDGNYTLALNGASVTDAQWNPLAGSSSVNFFTLAGDANHDRVVDTIDFNALAANFGGSGKNYSQGDFNYDGTVDTIDFNTLAGQFGKSQPEDGGSSAAAASQSAVPAAASGSTKLFSNIAIDGSHSLIDAVLA